jgi:hypothetical protein
MRTRGRCEKELDMSRQSDVVMVLGLVFLISLTATRAVEGQVPSAVDFAACNEEAPQSVKAGTATPIMGDYLRAVDARGGDATSSAPATGKALDSLDPQIHGMEAQGATSALYQAAYRSCMRRKGF